MTHDQADCWAKDKQCFNCDKMGHVAPACRGPKRVNEQSGSTSHVEGCLGSLEATIEDIVACSTTNQVIPKMETLEAVHITFVPDGQSAVKHAMFLPDTGANVTAIAETDAQGVPLSQTSVVLRTADGNVLRTLGTFEASLTLCRNTARERIHVVRGLSRPLLSRRMLKELGLIHKDFPNQEISQINIIENEDNASTDDGNRTAHASENPETDDSSSRIESEHGPAFDKLVNEYRDLFSGRCTQMKSQDYHIDVEADAKPISYGACRSVADPYMPALKRELDTLVEQDIIEKISYATAWLHPIVVVPKKGTTDIRLCVDFSKLNRYVVRPVNPQPTPWETVRNLPRGIKHFAVFDALKGYHQIPLAEESRDLTAFMTPFGRFRYKRLAFGLNSASDVFTLKYGNAVDKATDGLRATEDTLIRGSTSAELVENTRRFFDACRENGITLNLRKIQWDQREVLFAGFLLDPTGYRIDPALNKALLEFPTPTSPTDIRSFYGLANQMCNFSQEIADLLAPLKSLLKKGVMFQFLPEHDVAFRAAREHLASSKTLAYYCPRRMTRLVVDASRLNGLGFVLKQKQDDGLWRAVQAGSRFLTSAETRYAMIELECLAIAWACDKCRMFVDGLPFKQFQVWTDHAPLVPILNRQALPDIANRRLQRLKMKVEHLTFETVWVKGVDNEEADALSRHPCARATAEDELDEDVHVAEEATALFCSAETTALKPTPDDPGSVGASEEGFAAVLIPFDRRITDERLRELKSFASEDDTYVLVSQLATKGFPNVPFEEIPENLKPFYKVYQELTVDSDGFLCRNDALVVPHTLVKTYLERLLAMHQAAPKMLARARRSLWWPYMTRDINAFAKTCQPCEESKPSNAAEVILSHEPADYPFQILHVDLGYYRGRNYLFSVDQFSGYPHINDMGNNTTTPQTIDAIVDLVTHFSVPEVIYSDGGPQFTSDLFSEFCKKWGIRHVTSSPYMPRSNGIAESAVKEMKKIVRANVSPNGILNRSSAMSGLQMFRNTPRSGTGESPAKILFGHDVRDSLPCKRAQLLPQHQARAAHRLVVPNVTTESLPQRAVSRSGPTRELSLLTPRTPVRIQNPITKKWYRTGFVIGFGANQREYIVRSGHVQLRRNRHWLKPIDIEAEPAISQPAQAPSLPATPAGSNFPVAADWFRKPGLDADFDDDQENPSSPLPRRSAPPTSQPPQSRPESVSPRPGAASSGTTPTETSTPLTHPPSLTMAQPPSTTTSSNAAPSRVSSPSRDPSPSRSSRPSTPSKPVRQVTIRTALPRAAQHVFSYRESRQYRRHAASV